MNVFSKRFVKYFLSFITGAAILMAGLVVYLVWFQPAFYFPKPAGPYAVGAKTYHWIDSKRKETLHDDPAHPYRELMVKLWYPSTSLHFTTSAGRRLQLPQSDSAEEILSAKPTTPYAPYLVEYFKKNKPLTWLLAFSRPIFSYAQPEVSIASKEAPYPVIIFSPGGGGMYDSNSARCEELASHGYVVVGMSHTYESLVVEFPDGRTIYGTEEQRKKNKNFIERRTIIDQELAIRIADVQFVLDQLEQLNNNQQSLFYHKLDVNNSGIFGQSMGGAVAAQVCRRDSRVKAGVNLDGSLFGPDPTKNFDKPFMFMPSGDNIKLFERSWNQDDWQLFGVTSITEEKMVRERYIDAYKELAQAIGHDAYIFAIKNAGHLDFTNTALIKHAPLFSRFLISSNIAGKLGITGRLGFGSINGFRATEIVNAYMVAFFNKYLKNIPSDLLDGNQNRYSEVEAKH